MKIKCTNCGYVEETNKDFFVKLIGGAMPVGGVWAWTTYLFAGTGFAMAIVIAIIGGGLAMLIFKDEIVGWVINKDYKCPECGQVEWKAEDGSKLEVAASTATPHVIKGLVEDESTTVEKTQATGAVTTTLRGEVVKGTVLLSPAITATPGVVRELVLSPTKATAAYVSEDTGVSYNEAEQALLASLPPGASDAVKQSIIASSRLVAQMMKEEGLTQK